MQIIEPKEMEREAIKPNTLGMPYENEVPASPTERAEKRTWRIGFSRPALEIEALPAPEKVFNARKIGWEELLLLILGPSVIALGVSFGSAEWFTAPMTLFTYGVKGLGIVLFLSTLLQVFYNVELARFTLATGESPLLALGRLPLGYWFWIPFGLLLLFLTFSMGNWTVDTGLGFYAFIRGEPISGEDLSTARYWGILFLVVSLLILTLGRRIVRTLEIIQGIFMPYVLLGLLFITLIVVPRDFLYQSMIVFISPAKIPEEIPASELSYLVGFIALAAGLNFMLMGYYRDKGFGMGFHRGAFTGLIGGGPTIIALSGSTFEETVENATQWKRWFRYVLVDQWLIYFLGMLMCIMLPSTLMVYVANIPTFPGPEAGSIASYLAYYLGQRYGPLVSGWLLVSGFIILFTTQVVLLELLARNFTEGLLALSGRLRRWAHDDARKLYYPMMLMLILVISISLFQNVPIPWQAFLQSLPSFAGMIFPLALMYLNRQLPRPARITWWSYLVLLGNAIFFGYFWFKFMQSTFFAS